MKTKLPVLLALLAALVLPTAAGAATVSALGRVLPRSGIIDIPGTVGDTVRAIHVNEGDWVEAGQSLAMLSSAAGARQQLQQAEADLTETRRSAARDVEIARARLVTAELEREYAVNRHERILAAGDSEFISPDQIEARTLGRKQAEIGAVQARQNLAAAEAAVTQRIRAAELARDTAQAALAAAEVRAPIAAQVLKIRGRVGMQVNGRIELFKLGDTAGMNVVAEVYESEVLKVQPGQKAVVSAAALPAKMTGVVTGVSPIAFRNTIESMDPNTSTQARVVEVTIRMDQVEPLDRLVFLQVDVTIDI
jgi:HlyD family secretion protein